MEYQADNHLSSQEIPDFNGTQRFLQEPATGSYPETCQTSVVILLPYF